MAPGMPQSPADDAADHAGRHAWSCKLMKALPNAFWYAEVCPSWRPEGIKVTVVAPNWFVTLILPVTGSRDTVAPLEATPVVLRGRRGRLLRRRRGR